MSDTQVRIDEAEMTSWALDPAEVRSLVAWVRARHGGGTRTSTTPLTGDPLADIPLSTPRDVADAVADARRAQRAWASTSVATRAAVLRRVHDLVLERQSEVLDLVQLETGKARANAYEEVADVALVAAHYARRAGRYLADRRTLGLVPVLGATTVHRRPVGVVGVVAPWNYPLSLTLGDTLPALAAGNAVVLKPDVTTSLTAAWAVGVLADAGLPHGLVQLVTGDGAQIGGAVVDHVDHVLFTGSTATGRTVGVRAAERIVGASLELGGKNAFYVAEDVDVDAAAEGAVRACFSGTGQLCLSMERLVLHEAVADRFLEAFLPRVRALRLGAGLDWTADVGSLASQAQMDRVRAHVDDAVARGAVVLAGGVHRTDVGPLFHDPTVLDRVPQDAVVRREETFGPVVSVYRVRHDEEAIRVVNDTEYGLNASVWTRDLARGRRLASRMEAGMVNINEGYAAAWGSTGAPAGGVKASGSGRRHGPEGLHETTWTQTVAVQRGVHAGWGLGRLYGMPAETWSGLFTKALRIRRFFA